MLEVEIPGSGVLSLRHLVLDYNGTLALDGELLPGIADQLQGLAHELAIHVLTGDTFGGAESRLAGLPCKVTLLRPDRQAEAKRDYVEILGASSCVCVGNGRNDRLMLEASALAIAVVQKEGACVEALMAADLVVPSIHDALDLLAHPRRLVATLRG